MRASSYTPGGKATVSYTNRNYYLRGMFTYSTGLNEKDGRLPHRQVAAIRTRET